MLKYIKHSGRNWIPMRNSWTPSSPIAKRRSGIPQRREWPEIKQSWRRPIRTFMLEQAKKTRRQEDSKKYWKGLGG